ncbi:MAG: hypothetical protein K8F91_09555 [Candidatus Obscuribacterales bacterium]|nr:hypothetical protein [Candidatus Obscuribacterales bacterium]
MSQNTRLLLVALVILVVFCIFLQSLIARSLSDTFGADKGMPEVPKPRSPSAQNGDAAAKQDGAAFPDSDSANIPKPVPAGAK